MPSNWVWTSFDKVVEFPKDKYSPSNSKEELKYIGLEHIQKNGGIITNGSSKEGNSAKNIFTIGDILYGRLRPYLNKHDITSFDGICSTDILVLRCNNNISNAKFVNYYLDIEYVMEYTISNSKGINLPRVSEKELGVMSFPLLPLVEQQSIIERIESLFGKLDTAKELVQNVLDYFENRKSSILYKAFTGELTVKWREENNLSLDSWEEKELKEVTKIISGTNFKSQDFNEKNAIPCVKITNVGVYRFVEDDTEYLPSEFLDEYDKYQVKQGDILIALTRPFINAGLKVCIYEKYSSSLLNQRVALIRGTNGKYIYNYLRTSKVLEYVKEKCKTTNQPNLSIKDLEKLIIPIPSHREQEEITDILENVFSKEQQAQKLCDIIKKIDFIKKSILARAFRGELGTNNPAEESAEKLLREILEKKLP